MLRFVDNEYFLFLLLIPVFIGIYYFVFKWKKRALARFGNLELVNKLSESTSRGRQIGKAVLLICGVLFMTLALAVLKSGLVWKKSKGRASIFSLR